MKQDPMCPCFQPAAFAATTWTDTTSTSSQQLGIYFASHGGIQELRSAVIGGAIEDWTQSTLVVLPGATVTEDSPIACTSVGGLIHVFFCDTEQTLRGMIYDAQAKSWGLGSLQVKLDSLKPQLQAVAWLGQDKHLCQSVFFTRVDGNISEVTKRHTSEWEIRPAVNALGQSPFWANVNVENDTVTKQLFYRSGPRQLDEATCKSDFSSLTDQSPPWTSRQVTAYAPVDESEVLGITGTPLPSNSSSPPTGKLILNLSSTRSVCEYSIPANSVQGWGGTVKVPYAQATPGSSMQAITVTGENDQDSHVHLFYLSEDDGKLVTTNWDMANGWRTFITVVAVYKE
ncbi:hypothetical protein FRB94_004758 [Tulasnella sp. JGI-2019a]|nr:hypothetical protein FRB93_004854 [Tulasnella sp. JGI-2019a]KAG9001443.1 hypothetical protein FRB94_004758 [Tulasnella sp. JGI-2019a]